MNIHTLNDLRDNNNNMANNNISNSNANNQNNQFFLPGMNPDNQNQNSFIDFLFPKAVYKIKTVSFYMICVLTSCFCIQLLLYYLIFKPNGYSWGCLLYLLGASEISSITNHYQFFRIITPMLTHNNFGHLFSNCLSILFIGFYVEYEIKNNTNYLLLFFISGIIGNFSSLLFSYENLSMGASGAILGLCAYYILYFIFNWNNLNNNMKCCAIIFFVVIFLNLFSGVSEGSHKVDMHSHIGGFLGGLAFSMFLTYRSQIYYRFNQANMKLFYYLAIGFLVGLPIISVIVIILREVPDTCQYICLNQNMF